MKQRETQEKTLVSKSRRTWSMPVPMLCQIVLDSVTQSSSASRHRALTTVNRPLVCLYWNIGRAMVRQQGSVEWGDAVEEQFVGDSRWAFPDMKRLSGTTPPPRVTKTGNKADKEST